MKKQIMLILMAHLFIAPLVFGQANQLVFKRGLKSLYKGDSVAFLKAMDHCTKDNTVRNLPALAYFVQGEYYQETGRFDLALNHYQQALNTLSDFAVLNHKWGQTCDWFFTLNEQKLLLFKGDIYKQMSKCYLSLKLPDSALLVLSSIDANLDFSNHGGCLNGQIMDLSSVNYLKACSYLVKKDTMSAIQALTEYGFDYDGNSYGHAFQLLKELLFAKFGKAATLQELEKSLDSSKIIRTISVSGFVHYSVEFYFVGVKVPNWNFSDINQFKRHIRNSKLVLLMQTD